METVVIVIHLMVVVALIAVVLLQRSEGGALGIGGGNNNFLSSRGQGNVLTRATGILAATFFATSILMTILARMTAPPSSILDNVPAASDSAVPGTDSAAPATTPPSNTGTGGILDELNAFTGEQPAAPADGTTTAPADGTTTAPATDTTPPASGATTTAPAAPPATP